MIQLHSVDSRWQLFITAAFFFHFQNVIYNMTITFTKTMIHPCHKLQIRKVLKLDVYPLSIIAPKSLLHRYHTLLILILISDSNTAHKLSKNITLVFDQGAGW